MSKLVDREVLKAFREKLDEKYVIEGEYSPSTRVGNSDYADNLTPYSPNSGVYQSIPFNFQGTGCGNGETQVDTGSFCQFKEKRGNGIVYNQNLDFSSFENNSSPYYTTSVTAEGIFTYEVTTSSEGNIRQLTYPSHSNMKYAGHKYLVAYFPISDTSNSTGIRFWLYNANDPVITGRFGEIDKSGGCAIVLSPTTSTYTILLDFNKGVQTPVTAGEKIVFRLYLIDLTKWFNGNIPQYLLDHPESFFRYYSGTLTYNTGEVRFSNARYLKTYGRNQWDEQATFSGTDLSSTNYTRVVPAETYYLKAPKDATISYYDSGKNLIITENVTHDTTFTTPSNCIFIKFEIATYGSSYANDITISIYYDGESGYDKYYPFEQLQEVDTGTEQLYWAGTAYDKKGSNGLIERNIGSVDLGTLDWTYVSADGYFRAVVQGAYAPDSTYWADRSKVCAKYEYVGRGYYNVTYVLDKTCFTLRDNNYSYIGIKDSEYTDAATFKAAMSGVILYYELDTPTTEQGTPFTESVKIHDFGSMSLESANGVPQGNLIFYPVDYKAYEDTLINYTGGDATSLAKKSDIVQELPDAPSTDGTFVLKATVSSGTVSYEWVEEGA